MTPQSGPNGGALRRFNVEILVGSSWQPTPYAGLTETRAAFWARWYRGQGKLARLVRAVVETKVVH